MLGDNTQSVSSVTGHGTWSNITISQGSGAVADGELWGCITGGSPSSGTVTANHSSSGSSIVVVEVDADHSDTTVALSIVQSDTFSAYVTQPNPFTIDTTLSAFGKSTNLAILFAGTFGSGTATTFTEQGSLTQDHETTGADFNYNVSSFVGEDTSPSIQSTDEYTGNLGIAVEVADSSSANTTIEVPTGPIR
jgi:hypothetical protein